VKIAITSNDFRIGGAERQKVVLANALAQAGNHVTLLSFQAGGAVLDDRSADVQYRPLRYVFQGVLTDDFDVLMTSATNTEVARGLTWALIRRRRWIATSHQPPSPAGRTYGRLKWWALRRATSLVLLSESHESLLEVESRGARVHIVPNTTDLSRAASARKPVNAPLRLGFIGRLAPQKGLDILLNALDSSELRSASWQLDVYGDGPARGSLEALAAKLGDRVQFRGFSQTANALDSMDVLLMPSRNEAQPMVLLEAAARGVPVVASAVGGVAEMLRDGAAGVLVEPTLAGWVAAVTELLRNPDRLSDLAEVALQQARAYTPVDMAAAYLATLDAA
jgi:glycosyltransferase involved in cell wall biosynthesis